MRQQLRADCSRCRALCCTALGLAASADFAIDKAPGTPCPNLAADHRCTIHSELREKGFAGCVSFDCFGAGQQVTQVSFGGTSWRDTVAPSAVFAAFEVMRQLHELLWYLADPAVTNDNLVAGTAQTLATRIADLTGQPAELLLDVPVGRLRGEVDEVLTAVSARVRDRYPHPPAHRGADLVGRSLSGADLRGAQLRSALLIGADLRDADLTGADLLGADLRGARVHGSRLQDSLFLTQTQVASAVGDQRTTLPDDVQRPSHWRP